jgi:hypothetical protein
MTSFVRQPSTSLEGMSFVRGTWLMIDRLFFIAALSLQFRASNSTASRTTPWAFPLPTLQMGSFDVIVDRRDRRERGGFLLPVTPDSDPGSRISPQMTQIAQIRRPKMPLSVSSVASAVQFSNSPPGKENYPQMMQMNGPKVLGAGSLCFRRTLWRIFLSRSTVTVAHNSAD